MCANFRLTLTFSTLFLKRLSVAQKRSPRGLLHTRLLRSQASWSNRIKRTRKFGMKCYSTQKKVARQVQNISHKLVRIHRGIHRPWTLLFRVTRPTFSLTIFGTTDDMLASFADTQIYFQSNGRHYTFFSCSHLHRISHFFSPSHKFLNIVLLLHFQTTKPGQLNHINSVINDLFTVLAN